MVAFFGRVGEEFLGWRFSGFGVGFRIRGFSKFFRLLWVFIVLGVVEVFLEFFF